jgi:hypothetical protein
MLRRGKHSKIEVVAPEEDEALASYFEDVCGHQCYCLFNG